MFNVSRAQLLLTCRVLIELPRSRRCIRRIHLSQTSFNSKLLMDSEDNSNRQILKMFADLTDLLHVSRRLKRVRHEVGCTKQHEIAEDLCVVLTPIRLSPLSEAPEGPFTTIALCALCLSVCAGPALPGNFLSLLARTSGSRSSLHQAWSCQRVGSAQTGITPALVR